MHVLTVPPVRDTFEWWANIVIPAIAAAVSLAGAVASYFVARAALRVSQRVADLDAKRTDLEHRQWRHSLVPAVQDWLHTAAREAEDAPIWERILPVRAHTDLVRAMTARGDAAGVEMLNFLLFKVSLIPAGRERVFAEAAGSSMVDDWASDPATVSWHIEHWQP